MTICASPARTASSYRTLASLYAVILPRSSALDTPSNLACSPSCQPCSSTSSAASLSRPSIISNCLDNWAILSLSEANRPTIFTADFIRCFLSKRNLSSSPNCITSSCKTFILDSISSCLSRASASCWSRSRNISPALSGILLSRLTSPIPARSSCCLFSIFLTGFNLLAFLSMALRRVISSFISSICFRILSLWSSNCLIRRYLS